MEVPPHQLHLKFTGESFKFQIHWWYLSQRLTSLFLDSSTILSLHIPLCCNSFSNSRRAYWPQTIISEGFVRFLPDIKAVHTRALPNCSGCLSHITVSKFLQVSNWTIDTRWLFAHNISVTELQSFFGLLDAFSCFVPSFMHIPALLKGNYCKDQPKIFGRSNNQ